MLLAKRRRGVINPSLLCPASSFLFPELSSPRSPRSICSHFSLGSNPCFPSFLSAESCKAFRRKETHVQQHTSNAGQASCASLCKCWYQPDKLTVIQHLVLADADKYPQQRKVYFWTAVCPHLLWTHILLAGDCVSLSSRGVRINLVPWRVLKSQLFHLILVFENAFNWVRVPPLTRQERAPADLLLNGLLLFLDSGSAFLVCLGGSF